MSAVARLADEHRTAIGDVDLARRAVAQAVAERDGYLAGLAITGSRANAIRLAQLGQVIGLAEDHHKIAKEVEVAARARLWAERERVNAGGRAAAVAAAAVALDAARRIEQSVIEVRRLRERFLEAVDVLETASRAGVDLQLGIAPGAPIKCRGLTDGLGRRVEFAISGLPDAPAAERLFGRLAAEGETS